MAELLTGKEVAAALNQRSKLILEELKANNITPKLAIVRVGEKENDLSYEKGILKRCNELGVLAKQVVLPLEVEEEELLKAIEELNEDESVHGILLFRPLPKRMDEDRIVNAILPQKDVDGATDLSLAGVFSGKPMGFAPCTAQAAIEALDYYGYDLSGKNVAVVGRSMVVGKPLGMLLLGRHATVTMCHSRTQNLADITSQADIVVAAIGKPEILTASYFRENQVVLDVGVSYSEKKGKLCGDVDFDEVSPLVKAITPVPRGIGAITTAVLMNHVVLSAQSTLK